MEIFRRAMDTGISARCRRFLSAGSQESGATLIESLIAVFILMFALLALAQLMAMSLVVDRNSGRDGTKTTAYARDKIEELISLGFGDTTTNITVDPPYPSNGTGLKSGGSIPPAAALTGYVDYLDASGGRTTASNAFFTRQWQVIDDGTNLKRIVVSVISNRSFRYGAPPATVVVTLKGS